MRYDVLLTKDPQNGYTARPLLAPEISVTGTTEAETLARVRAALAQFHSQSRIVQVEVPDTDDDPWLRYAGMWKDDPDWDEFLADIEQFRREIDANMQNTQEDTVE